MEHVVPGVTINGLHLDRLMFIRRLVDSGKLTDYIYETAPCGLHVVEYGMHRNPCQECNQ